MKRMLWTVALVVLIGAGLVTSNLVGAAPGGKLGKMPEWRLKTVDGKMLSSKDLAGKVLVVDFWATWCPPCRQEIPDFIKLQKEHGGRGLQIVGFSFDRSEAAHRDFYRENKMNYPSMFAMNDEGRAVVAAFEKVIGKIEGIPTSVVVDRLGNIVGVHVGYTSKEEFEKEIKPLL